MSPQCEAAAEPLLSTSRRNWLWLVLQMLTRVAFTVWLRARTRGIDNLPAHGGGLLLLNHQSFLDPLAAAVWLSRPVSYLARDDLFRIPVIGWILRHTDTIPINRAGGSSAAIRNAIDRLRQGRLVGIFPEGTRSIDGELGELSPGFLVIARRANAPVIPVGIAGTGRALGRGSWFPKPCRIRVVIGEPLAPEELAALSDKGRETEVLQLISERIRACSQAAEDWSTAPTG